MNLLHWSAVHIVQASLHTSLVSLVYGNGWRDVSAIIGASERLRSEMQRERVGVCRVCERATDYVNPRFLRWIPIPSIKLQANNYCVACSYYVFFFLLLSRSVCCTSHRNLMSSCRAHSQLTVVHEPASRNGRISCPPLLFSHSMYYVYSVFRTPMHRLVFFFGAESAQEQ